MAAPTTEPPQSLHKGLKQRHLSMIAIGGVIGAGLFVGSGTVIGQAGPAAFLTYALCGVLIILVMRMLGEMATAHPSTGSFSDYARMALGDWAGFSVAWLYWYFWVVVVGFEAVAGAKIVGFWLPGVPVWLTALILMAGMTITNLFSVKSYGEFEYWFAGIKVAAIAVFIVIAALYVFGVIGGGGMHFSNLTANGGFFPNGVPAIVVSVVTVIFSMVGAEIATIAAAESDDPAKAILRATNSVIFRVSTFFILSSFLLACIVPWNDESAMESPFVAAFAKMGLPYADQIMNAVVLVAVLSCLNSGLYTASRMVFVLADRHEAPQALVKVSSNGVPRRAILFSSIVGFACVVAAFISAEGLFKFLLNSSGAIIIFAYILITVSQIVLRRREGDAGREVKMWAFPVLSVLALVAMVAILVQMAFTEDTAPQLWMSLLSVAVMLVAYVIMRRVRGPVTDEATPRARVE